MKYTTTTYLYHVKLILTVLQYVRYRYINSSFNALKYRMVAILVLANISLDNIIVSICVIYFITVFTLGHRYNKI